MRNKFAPFGIVHSLNNALVCLPLEQVNVHAEIVDVSATVTFTQTFWQGHPTQTKRAKYVFPIPTHAAICGFEMSTEDGRTVTAVAKETETAKQEHEQAIQEGKMTGLVVMASGDVFTVSLGCLPSMQMITTKLTYVMDLMEDDSADQIRLLLPVCIGSRYGQPPPEMAGAKIVPPERIRISVDVFMSGEIRSITSPSHPTAAVNDDRQVQIGNVPSSRRKAAQYACQDFLTEDFVLSVKSDGLDAPRCFAEPGPAGTVAMQLAVVPKLTLPNIPEQEYIFLVDRSGSMNGNRIATAKRALVLLLRALPARGTTFNVFSFGSRHDSLWEESRKYDEQSLEDATAHVDSMLANYGGTNLRGALEAIFETRCVSLPTSVFVLTDGNTYDLDNTINTVSDAVKAARPEAPLRIFTLGIGESTSTAMCEGVARVGNGLCLMSAATETILAKCSKLVKASRTVILQDVTIDWGAPEGLAIVSPLQSDNLQDIGLRQGPWKLPILYTGFRCTVFALVNAEKFALPDHVVIQARYTGTDVLKIPVAVQLLEAQSSGSPKRPLVHALAARRIIMDLEDADKAGSSLYKDAIVHLGEQYQLASRYTSFIAVEDRPSTSEDTPEERSPSPSLTSTRNTVAASVHPTVFQSAGAVGGMAPRKALASTGPPGVYYRQAPSASRQAPQSSWSPPGSAQAFATAHVENTRFAVAYRRAADVSPQQPAFGSTAADRRVLSTPMPLMPQARGPPRPDMLPASASFAASTSQGIAPPAGPRISFTDSRPESPPAQDLVSKLVRLQSFDGSFAVSDKLAAILGRAAVDARKDIEPQSVWATLLAIAYLQKHLADQPELLESLVEKAIEYVKGVSSVDVDALLVIAKGLVQ